MLGEKVGDKLAADTAIPRLQRRTSAPPLARFAVIPEHTTAFVKVFATSRYGMKKITQPFEIHDATVNRIAKMADNFWEMGDPTPLPMDPVADEDGCRSDSLEKIGMWPVYAGYWQDR